MQRDGSAGPVTKEDALKLVDEMLSSRRETARYRQAVPELRPVLQAWTRDSQLTPIIGPGTRLRGFILIRA